LQCHLGSMPKDHVPISVILLRALGMWRGVSGDTCFSFNHRASARRSWEVTIDPFADMQHTQCTVGELSLNSATWVLA
jgi:hypothetical protein